jgi:hypothetical protein
VAYEWVDGGFCLFQHVELDGSVSATRRMAGRRSLVIVPRQRPMTLNASSPSAYIR